MSEKQRLKAIILVILLTPSLWLIVLGKSGQVDSFSRWPKNISVNIQNVFSAENSQKVNLLRDRENTNFIDKLIYNKFSLVIDNFFSVISTISPKYIFTPIGSVEFVPILLFPSFLLWLYYQFKVKPILSLLLMYMIPAFILFLTAPDNLIIYSIIGIFITAISTNILLTYHIDRLWLKIFIIVLALYQIFLISRILS